MSTRPVPTVPEEIQITVRGTPLSAAQHAAIEGLRRQVFAHGRRAGAHFNELLVNNTPSVKTFNSFGAGVDKERVFFSANMQTFMGAYQQYELSGAIAHEAGHIKRGNIPLITKLAALSEVEDSLSELHAALNGRRGTAVSQQLLKEFGSYEAFAGKLERLEAKNVPIIKRMYAACPEIMTTSPERWACHIENDTHPYRLLKENIARTMGRAELEKMSDAIKSTCEKAKWFEDKEENVIKGEGLLLGLDVIQGKISSLLQMLESLGAKNLYVNFAKGEEYAADSHAMLHAESKDSMRIFLQQTAGYHAQSSGMPERDYFLYERGFRRHPSLSRRIKRLEHLEEHGVPPEDELLRPATSWQQRVNSSEGATMGAKKG